MFLVSKFLAFLTQPVSWAILLLLAGLLALRRWRKGGLVMCWAALVVLLLTGWLAPISVLMHQLESRYPPPPASTNLAQYKGVIVLGGAIEDSGYWEVPGRIALRAEGERMIVPVALMQRNPHLTMLFTGGDDNVSPGRLTEADRAKIFFDLLGVDASRVIYESKSRTTYENGLFSSQLPGVNVGEPWLCSPPLRTCSAGQTGFARRCPAPGFAHHRCAHAALHGGLQEAGLERHPVLR